MPKLSSELKKKVGYQPIDLLQSHFDALALQVRAWAGRRNRVLTLGIIGPTLKVGVTTVALNLANSLAESSFSGQVALVEAENASVNKQASTSGLIDLLAREKQLNDCLLSGWRENLKVLPFGKPEKSDARTIHWAKLSDLVQRELAFFDFVVFDLLPLSMSKFSHAIASQLDGLILVCRPEGDQESELNHLRSFLRDYPVEILGKVINRSRETRRVH